MKSKANTNTKKIQALREKRDNALIDAQISKRMKRSPKDDLQNALRAAIEIDKARGLY